MQATVQSKAKALTVAAACTRLLQVEFGAKRAIVFGSLAGQGPWHDRSDIDIAVEGLPPGEFFRAYSACCDLLPPGLNLDLVPLEHVYPEMRSRILQEVEMPDDPILALKGLVEDELITLSRVVNNTTDFMERLSDPPSQLELRGLASYLHDFYTGIESIFRRIAVRLDKNLPGGEFSHVNLLNQMSEIREGVRPAVIDEQLKLRLRDYLNFRHFFRHAYGYELNWNQMRLKLIIMPETLEMLRQQLMCFFDELASQ
ncbi:MAG: nucleotidyltransferase domain-containing protein [Hormoscilla sp. GUM202]|nr:nucleotidyltransferase domain-containing protein [Hormoscilla sp. GUM202]